jgi:tetratricopeptide (TPR) repeat protein
MPRGSLKRYLREKGKLTLKESLALGIQLCDGLLHAYDHDLEAHLDIKPANIMVYDDGLFNTTDFSAGIIGTPGYMAPEQVVAAWRIKDVELIPDEIPVDSQADQFAMGLVVLESYLGRSPFPICISSYSDEDQARRFVKEGVGELADFSLPVKLEEILNRILSQKPNDRYPDLSDLRENLVELYETKFGKYNVPEVEVDDTAEWWFDRGKAYNNMGRPAFAEDSFKEALERYRCVFGTELNQAICSASLANVYQQTGRFDDAERAYKSSLNTFHPISGTELDQTRCTMNLAIVYQQTGRFNDAERAYESALKTFRHIPSTELDQAGCKMNLGVVYALMGRFREAESAFGEALNTYSDIPGTELEQARCTMNLALDYEQTGRFDEAERAFESSLKTYRRIPGTELDQAGCKMNLANVYAKSDRFDEAERAYKSSLKSYRHIPGTELDQARCTMNLAIVYRLTNRLSEAESAYEVSLETYLRIPGTELKQAECMANLASFYKDSEKSTKARKLTQEALKLCEQFPPEATVEIRDKCQRILKELNNL